MSAIERAHPHLAFLPGAALDIGKTTGKKLMGIRVDMADSWTEEECSIGLLREAPRKVRGTEENGCAP